MTEKTVVLIAEDEVSQAEVLKYNLESAGFEVRLSTNGADALSQIDESRPDFLVLDWMLPEVSGIEICRRLRRVDENKDLPIIMVTARGEEEDRIRALEVGADDYMVKPYSPGELVARINAVLRRTSPSLVGEKLEFSDLVLDLVSRKVKRNGESLHLGPKEFKILQALMERPGRVLSRRQIIDLAWGQNIYIEDRTIDVHIRRLRSALGGDNQPNLIRTVRGFGYSLDEEQV